MRNRKSKLHIFARAVVVLSGIAFFVATAKADVAPPAEAGSFAEAMANGRSFESRGMTGQAESFYESAEGRAKTDDERAQAWLAAAKTTPIRSGNPNPATDGNLKIASYRKVIDLAGASIAAKTEAYFGIAQTDWVLTKYDPAIETLDTLAQVPDISTEAKRSIYFWKGGILVDARRYDEGRAQLAQSLPGAKGDQLVKIGQTMALSYLRQNQLSDALTEIAKIDAEPGRTDPQNADLYLANGDMLGTAGFHQAARDEYSKVAALTAANPDQSTMALIKVGSTFFNESNFARAREVWQQLLATPVGGKRARVIWALIGRSYLDEKNYPAARDAYQKWLSVPDATLEDKVEAWCKTSDSYLQEKNFVAAREALTNLSLLVPDTSLSKTPLTLRQQLETANVYRNEGNFSKVAETCVAVLALVPVRDGAEPPYNYETRDAVVQVAGEMSKVGASMAAAYTIYEALEKTYPYEKQKAEALLGMGDILLAQGKKEEAITKYQKAYDLRKNYDEGKVAAEKLRRLKTPGNAGGTVLTGFGLGNRRVLGVYSTARL